MSTSLVRLGCLRFLLDRLSRQHASADRDIAIHISLVISRTYGRSIYRKAGSALTINLDQTTQILGLRKVAPADGAANATIKSILPI